MAISKITNDGIGEVDSLGTVLVGKTAQNVATVGIEARENGSLIATKDGDKPLLLNRLTSDGDIVEFRKDGTTVGSIGIQSSGFYIDGESGHEGMRFANGAITPRENGGDSDGTSDLGASNNRFKDLYLSGGVYLGGTGSANLLDDYEEGTWTPIFEAGTTPFSSVTYDPATYGKYVKVGDLVHIQGLIKTDAVSGGSGVVYIGGAPFTSSSATSVSVGYTSAFSGDYPSGGSLLSGSTAIALLYRTSANGALNIALDVTDLGTGGNDNYIEFSCTYRI